MCTKMAYIAKKWLWKRTDHLKFCSTKLNNLCMYSSWSFIDSYLGQFFKIFTFAVLMSRDFELQRKSWSLFSWYSPFMLKYFCLTFCSTWTTGHTKKICFFLEFWVKYVRNHFPIQKKTPALRKYFRIFFSDFCAFYFYTHS